MYLFSNFFKQFPYFAGREREIAKRSGSSGVPSADWAEPGI